MRICGRIAMLRITVEITGEVEDAQGVKEKLAMELERHGNVRVVKVERVEPEQIRLEVPRSDS